jgi:hypothetical protein
MLHYRVKLYQRKLTAEAAAVWWWWRCQLLVLLLLLLLLVMLCQAKPIGIRTHMLPAALPAWRRI